MDMTIMKLVKPILSAVLLVAAVAPAVLADPKPPAPGAAAAATLKEVEQMMGFVPAFVRSVPATLLPAWWQTAKDFEMNPTTALDGKTKQLIGLAVAAQIPCEYCIIYHTEAARLEGASEQQIQEAVGMAAITRESSTLLYGLQVDKAQFRKDIDHLVKNAHQASAKK